MQHLTGAAKHITETIFNPTNGGIRVHGTAVVTISLRRRQFTKDREIRVDSGGCHSWTMWLTPTQTQSSSWDQKWSRVFTMCRTFHQWKQKFGTDMWSVGYNKINLAGFDLAMKFCWVVQDNNAKCHQLFLWSRWNAKGMHDETQAELYQNHLTNFAIKTPTHLGQ